MSWFDNISKGADSVMDWMGGGKKGGGGGEAKQAPAAAAVAGGAHEAPAAEKSPWGESSWAKATGLAPWAKALGAGQGPEQDPSKGGTMASRVDHQLLTGYGTRERPKGGDSAGDIVSGDGQFRRNTIEGDKKVTGFGRDTEKGGFKTPEYNSWSANGRSFGNRTEDVEADELGSKGKATAAPTVWQPSLDKIGNSDRDKPGYDPRSTGYNNRSGVLTKDDAGSKIDDQKKSGQGGGYSDGGSFRSSKGGSFSGRTGLGAEKYNSETGKMEADPTGKFTTGHNGKGSMGIAGWEGQWGAEEKGGWRATAMSENKQHSATAEAGWVASGGASGSYGLDTAKGAYAQGGFGGKVGAYAQADADTKTSAVKVGGVDYDMGAGVHGEAFVGAKAGASGEIGLGPDFIGAKGNIGAFAGFEAAGDLHANLGPLGAKAGGSVMAGAGIGAEGDLSYKDGKFHVGGKMFAALGYGGALSADMTIDVGAMGRSAHALGSAAGTAMYNGGAAAGTAIYNGGAAAGTAIYNGGAAAGTAIYNGGAAAGTAIYNGGAAAAEGIGNAANATWNAGASAVSSVLSW